MPRYVVKQGDCLSSIAKGFGLDDWKIIYNHPDNADFRKKRPDPNVIYPGDTLEVPAKEKKEEPGATEKRHKFRYTKDPTMFRLRLEDSNGKAFASKRFELTIGSDVVRGRTGSDGRIAQPIDPSAREGKLLLWPDNDSDEYTLNWRLQLGGLDPVEYLTGVQARLRNLGYNCGPVDGIMGPKTEAALKAFQAKNNLQADGTPSPQTQAKLKQLHGS